MALPIYFFATDESAREGFAQLTSHDGPRIFILPSEQSIPREKFRNSDRVYFLSACHYFDTAKGQYPEWRARFSITLFHVFMMDQWDELQQGYTFISADENAVSIFNEFISTTYFQYQKFYDHVLSERISSRGECKNILIYNNDGDPVMESLFDSIKASGERIFRINGKTGLVETIERDKEIRFPTAESFANDLIQHHIGTVYFRNFYDMTSSGAPGISKLWVMQRLKIRAISIVIDSLLDGVNPVFVHFLPRNVEVKTLHTTETYDAYKNYFPSERLHKSRQVIPTSRYEPASVQQKPIEGVFAASGSRFSFLQNQIRVSMLLLPIAKVFAEKKLPIYLTYFLFLESAQRAEKTIALRDRFHFFDSIAAYSIILRTLIRYLLIDQTAKATREAGLSFQLFGDADWKKVFPTQYAGRYITQEELEKNLQSKILLDPTPSTTYLSQHPMIPRYLYKGGSVMAPAPLETSELGSLKRFYFGNLEDVQTALLTLLKNPRPTEEERRALVRDLGVDHLYRETSPGEALSYSQAYGKIAESDRTSIRQFDAYVLAIFRLTHLKEPRSSVIEFIQQNSSREFFEDISHFINHQKDYLASTRRKYPFFNFF
jgi:hypothetical protein